ncbi:MAG: hypothetical protein JXR31_13065 [Prolixibacteraceae bacterium]|nr:hypothetical protein [Prolixibacteraceae bacterium]
MYQERKDFSNNTFVNENGKTLALTGGGEFGSLRAAKSGYKVADTQTSYDVVLALGTFHNNKIQQMAQNLAQTVERENTDDGAVVHTEYSLMTGFIGTAWISKALSDKCYNKPAYNILQNDKYPS